METQKEYEDKLIRIFRENYRLFVKLSRDITHNTEDAEDVIQNTFFRFLTKRPEIRKNGAAMMKRTIIRDSTDFIKKSIKHRYSDGFIVDDENTENAAFKKETDATCKDAELKKLFDDLRENLKKSQKETLTLMQASPEAKPKEIAQKQGTSSRHVRMNKTRIKKHLSPQVKAKYPYIIKSGNSDSFVFRAKNLKWYSNLPLKTLQKAEEVFTDKEILPYLSGRKSLPTSEYASERILNAAIMFLDLNEQYYFFNQNICRNKSRCLPISWYEILKRPVFSEVMTKVGEHYPEPVRNHFFDGSPEGYNTFKWSEQDLIYYLWANNLNIITFNEVLSDPLIFVHMQGFESKLPNTGSERERLVRFILKILNYWKICFLDNARILTVLHRAGLRLSHMFSGKAKSSEKLLPSMTIDILNLRNHF